MARRSFITNFRGEAYTPSDKKVFVKEEPVTPFEDDFGDQYHIEDYYENRHCGALRKSLSMSDINALRHDLVKLELDDKNDVYERYRNPSEASHDLSRTKFVSMAEAIYHYQTDTPGRFHSTRPQIFRTQGPQGRLKLTIPQSPMLRCKTRTRPQHILSQREKEEMEIEELKKFKIKANPVPKSVIEGSHLREVPKKPITCPEPFNLTEVHRKVIPITEPINVFKARPVPKEILQKPVIPVKIPIKTTKPVSPNLHFKKTRSVDDTKKDKKFEKLSQSHGPTKPEPFSFEKRNEELKKKREERIKLQIEEERKQACQFKAQPLPVAVKKQMHQVNVKGSSSTTSSESKENNFKFEAKPPTVLFKEPFKPVLQQPHVLKPVPFELTTKKRAAEREKFENELKKKEEEQERLRQMLEKEKREEEEKAKAEMRAKLVHHAKPIPVTAPFIPEKSVAPLTVPETPTFIRRLKKH